MNKDRHPIPEDMAALCMQQIHITLKLTGMDKIPAVMHHAQLMQEEMDRHDFNSNHQVSSQDRDNTDKRRFIMIFKNRYLESTDFEYSLSITQVEAKLISQVNKALREKGFACDEYLKWLFEIFLPDNTKFLPATVKFSCSGFVLTRFFYENKELLKENQERELRRREGITLMNRGRQIIRQSSNLEEIEKVKNLIKDYAESRIMLDGLRRGIDEYEREHARMSERQQKITQVVAGE